MEDRSDLELRLQAVTNELANELIALTPEFMNEIQFETVSTDDGGADIGLMEIHPEVKHVAFSPFAYTAAPSISRWLSGMRQVGDAPS